MAHDYSYKCKTILAQAILASVKDKHNRKVLLCEFQCEDEHGHTLAPAQCVVVYDGKTAQIEDEASNILDEMSCTEKEYNWLQGICDRAPEYEFYNPELVAKLVAEELQKRFD